MIIGHETIINFLGKAISNGRVSHAYLFVGPEHVGKRRAAEWFTGKLVNVPEDKLASHPDFYILERGKDEDGNLEKNIGIDQVREMRKRLGLSSFLNSWKVALICGAETLTSEAANALLKTLEEPCQKVCIILLAAHFQSLPETIISRCQVLRFQPVSTNCIYKALLSLGANRDEALKFSRLSTGLPETALKFFNDKAEREQFEKSFNALFSLQDYTFARRLNVSKALLMEAPLSKLLDIWIFVLRQKVFLYYNCNELVLSPHQSIDSEGVSDAKGRGQGTYFADLLRKLIQAKQLLQWNVNKNIILENILINL